MANCAAANDASADLCFEPDPQPEGRPPTLHPEDSPEDFDYCLDEWHDTGAEADSDDDGSFDEPHSSAAQQLPCAHEQLSDAHAPLPCFDEPPPYSDAGPSNVGGSSMPFNASHADDGFPPEAQSPESPLQGPGPPPVVRKNGKGGSDGKVDHSPISISIAWGDHTVQDEDMSAIGIAAHPNLHILTCLDCKCVIDPCDIRKHVSLHVPRSMISKDYCQELQNRFSLIAKKDLKIPGEIIPAIPTLPVFRDLPHCPECGYAVKVERSLEKHKCCGKMTPGVGYAQAYFPKENHGGFFAVTVTEPTPPEPGLDLTEVLKQKYPDPVPGQVPITLPQHVKDTNPFLARSNWAEVVKGLTGERVWNAVRKDNDQLRGWVTPSVRRYIADVNAKLKSSNNDVEGMAIGSYYGFVQRPPDFASVL